MTEREFPPGGYLNQYDSIEIIPDDMLEEHSNIIDASSATGPK